MGLGNGGLGIGDSGLGIGTNPQSPKYLNEIKKNINNKINNFYFKFYKGLFLKLIEVIN